MSNPSQKDANCRTWATVASTGLDSLSKQLAESRGMTKSEYVRFCMAQEAGDPSLAEIGTPIAKRPEPLQAGETQEDRNIADISRILQASDYGVTLTELRRQTQRMSRSDMRSALERLESERKIITTQETLATRRGPKRIVIHWRPVSL